MLVLKCINGKLMAHLGVRFFEKLRIPRIFFFFFEIMLDCLENLGQNYKKLDKILAEFDIWKICLTQTCHRKRKNCKVSIGVKDIKVGKKNNKKNNLTRVRASTFLRIFCFTIATNYIKIEYKLHECVQIYLFIFSDFHKESSNF